MRKEIKQRIFSRVSKHLLTQNKKSRAGASGSCLFRGPKDTKCAIGCLIPDSIYDTNMEGPIISNVLLEDTIFYSFEQIEQFTVLRKLFLKMFKTSKFVKSDIIFLSKLQKIHDSKQVIEWRGELGDLALKEGLKFE